MFFIHILGVDSIKIYFTSDLCEEIVHRGKITNSLKREHKNRFIWWDCNDTYISNL